MSTLNPTTASTAGAATSSAANSNNDNTGNATNRGRSTRELVGVAIGLLIAGALIAGLAVFLIMRRKGKNRTRDYDPVHEQHTQKETIVAATDGRKGWQRHLPQSEPDHAIARSTTQLLDQIELHVENYYTDRSVKPETVSVDRSLLTLSDALTSGLNPTSAIKKAVITVVLSTIDFERKSDYALMPATFNTARMQSDHNRQGKYRDTQAALSDFSAGIDQVVAEWRTLTAYLASDTLQTEPYVGDRERRISTLSSQLLRAFEPWLNGDVDDCQRSTNAILRRGSDLGILLFSQPSSFSWIWGENNSAAGRGRTVLPGLARVTDERSRPLAKEVSLVQPRTGA